MFYPLYPVGIGAEWWLLYRSIAPGAKVSPVIPLVFYFCLLLYIPGMILLWRLVYTRNSHLIRFLHHVHLHDQAKKEDTGFQTQGPVSAWIWLRSSTNVVICKGWAVFLNSSVSVTANVWNVGRHAQWH